MAVSSLSASGVRWNLDDLMPSADAARKEWDELLARARAYADQRRGTVRHQSADAKRRHVFSAAEIVAHLREWNRIYGEPNASTHGKIWYR